jgi:endogenous inhibitor of DNA gyrase (YacG/DUF329 family)
MGMPALCVLCRRHPVEEAWRPFCSQRCKLQDLARWATGAYRVPGEAVPEPDDRDSEKEESKS